MNDLTSWKEIASVLGVTVRTAQSYERERGLPIQRSTTGRVSAEREAIAAWQARQEQPIEQTCFRWPVGKGITAEVRFFGITPGAEHIELLRQYLDLVKNA